MSRSPALALLATLFAASSASAEFVDFRSTSQFGGSDYRTSVGFTTESGATATMTPGPTGARFYWGSDTGFGVRYTGIGAYDYNEIEGPETVTIVFSEPVYIESFDVTQFYRESSGLLSGTYNETGSYRLSDGTTTSFSSAGNPSGQQTVGVGAWTQSIVFRAAGYVGGIFGIGTQNHEYSLAGITFGSFGEPASVPELDPSAAGTALILLLGGLMVLGGRRRDSLFA